MQLTIDWIKNNTDWMQTNISQLIEISSKYELKEIYYTLGDVLLNLFEIFNGEFFV